MWNIASQVEYFSHLSAFKRFKTVSKIFKNTRM